MNNQKNKDKDKNVRISENDIQKKLYGNFTQPENKEKPLKGKFSENIIKNKLYGNSQPDLKGIDQKAGPVPAANDLFNSKQTISSKTGHTEHDSREHKNSYSQKEKTVGQDINHNPEKVKIMPAYQDEIDALKQAIANLENKLQKTEVQKYKLKVKLVQKRKLINIREGLADLILNKMPEKFLMLLALIIAAFLAVMVLNQKPKSNLDAKQTMHMQTDGNSQNLNFEPVKNSNVKQPELKSKVDQPRFLPIEAVHRYTIQVAEYADEKAAMNFINDLKSQGFDVYLNTIYRGENNTRPYFKINVGSFDTFNQAKLYNLKFREKTNINDSFIREKKK